LRRNGLSPFRGEGVRLGFVFERFTERARQVVVLADDEARRLNHAYIGTEHFLLGLVRQEEGLAARALASFGVEVDRVRSDVTRIVGLGDEQVAPGELPLTPRMPEIIALSKHEADQMGRKVIGTEHLLLGLAREGNGVANVILLGYGVRSEDIRVRVIDFISGRGRRPH
jgi:ATP-dependent Clp protease ATP-binding subunit ClpC